MAAKKQQQQVPEGCTHDCSTCGADCPSKKPIEKDPANKDSRVKHIIGVVSGKGGVGKSLVTSLLALGTERLGKKAAIMDTDITGPSIPRIFGVSGDVLSNGEAMIPLESENGTKIISIGFFLEHPDDPVVWRGPVIAGTVKQFWTDVAWGDVDYMYVDMPPGTGDVPLTVFQSLPLDGVVIVTSPQQLVGEIVGKAVNMAAKMNIPVLGLIENMSYLRCPDCGRENELYGPSSLDELAKKYKLTALGKIPIDPVFASLCDNGEIESTDSPVPKELAEKIVK